MRIIGGFHRSRQLLGPKDWKTTRPMTDRVKQSLFDRLWSMALFENDGEEAVAVVDLFSGTGSLGLEAVSRGAAHCTFVELDRDARDRLYKNVALLKAEDQATVLGVDILSATWLDLIPDGQLAKIGLIFCDPPYRMSADPIQRPRLVNLLDNLLAVTVSPCVLMLRTDDQTEPLVLGRYGLASSHRYGSTVLHFYHC